MVALTLLALVAGLFSGATAWRGNTKTSWDCCKPACAWTSTLRNAGARGSVRVCNKDDNTLSNGASAQTSCASSNAGNAYLCSDYQPRPLSEDLSIGFAIMKDGHDCCRCFELTWQDGPAAGKRMQVQVINEGGDDTDVIIVTPGGGIGPNIKGCDSQYGFSNYDWGRQYGGVESREGCENLPSRLQGGCYWRYNWARGDINDWPVEVRNISCPDQLKSISGCDAGDDDNKRKMKHRSAPIEVE